MNYCLPNTPDSKGTAPLNNNWALIWPNQLALIPFCHCHQILLWRFKLCASELGFKPYLSVVLQTQDDAAGMDENLDWKLFIMSIYLTDILLEGDIKSEEPARKNRVLGWEEARRGK